MNKLLYLAVCFYYAQKTEPTHESTERDKDFRSLPESYARRASGSRVPSAAVFDSCQSHFRADRAGKPGIFDGTRTAGYAKEGTTKVKYEASET